MCLSHDAEGDGAGNPEEDDGRGGPAVTWPMSSGDRRTRMYLPVCKKDLNWEESFLPLTKLYLFI